MSTTITLPQGWPYVVAALVSTNFMVLGQIIVVGRFRKLSGIKYPQLYAEQAQVEKSLEAKRFNCAQRAHQNTLEYLPILYTTTLVTALEYPIVAASICGLWTLSRIPYTRGYVSGDPNKREGGARISSLTLIGLLLTSAYVAGKAVVAQLGY